MTAPRPAALRFCRSVLWALLLLAVSPLFAARHVPPLTFVYDLDSGALEVLAELRLNTLYLDLPPAAVLDLETVREIIRKAKAQGLHVVVGLPTTQPYGGRVSPTDARYRGAVDELITHCVRSLRDEPGVTAWGMGHCLERVLSYTDADFRAFLQKAYPSLDALNDAWQSNFRTWLEVTMTGARQVDAGRPNLVGRASVDLADYERLAFHEVMQGWLQVLRAQDPDRPVLTGRVTLYRSLAAIPDGYDVVCVSTPPDVLDPDGYAHNPQGLDLGRRAGKFQVLAVLRPPAPGSSAYQQDRFRDWVCMAAVHGACGIAVESWDMLQPAYDMEQRFSRGRRLCEALQMTATMPWGLPLAPTAAVLYEPYAEGREVTGQPTYGFVRGLLPGEPAELLWGLRLGSRFGPVDCLTLDEVLDVELKRYGLIMMPACLRLPPQVNAALADYLQEGGAVLTDLGLGAYDTGSWTQVPSPWDRLLGLAQLGNLQERAGDLRVGTAVVGLPSVRVGLSSHGIFRAGVGGNTAPATARKSYAVGGLVAETLPTDEAVAFAPLSVRFDEEHRAVFSGLLAHRYGLGLAIFATHSLWPYWPLADGLSAALHGDLLARRATYELDQPGVWQSGLHFGAAEDRVALANFGRDPTLANVWAYGAAGAVFKGAVSRVAAVRRGEGYPAGTVQLTALVPGRGWAVATRLPLYARPLVEDAALFVDTYDRQALRLVVAGAGASIQARRGSELVVEANRETAVRLVLKDGLYRVAPGSHHVLARTTRGGQQTETVLTADATGALDLSGYYRRDTLVLRPAPTPEDN